MQLAARRVMSGGDLSERHRSVVAEMTPGLRVTVGMTQPRAILPVMKLRDYAHLGAKARLEQLQEEIAQIHRDFPALKHTTAQTAPNRSAWTPKQRTGVSKRMKAVRKARKKAQS